MENKSTEIGRLTEHSRELEQQAKEAAAISKGDAANIVSGVPASQQALAASKVERQGTNCTR